MIEEKIEGSLPLHMQENNLLIVLRQIVSTARIIRAGMGHQMEYPLTEDSLAVFEAALSAYKNLDNGHMIRGRFPNADEIAGAYEQIVRFYNSPSYLQLVAFGKRNSD